MPLACLTGMKNREERSKHFFDSGPLMEEDEDLALYDKVRTTCLELGCPQRAALKLKWTRPVKRVQNNHNKQTKHLQIVPLFPDDEQPEMV